jgi:hypothetical protein
MAYRQSKAIAEAFANRDALIVKASKNNQTTKEIARAHNLTTVRVRQILRANGFRQQRTGEETRKIAEQIAELKEKKIKRQEIAKLLGLKLNYVNYFYYDHNTYRAMRPAKPNPDQAAPVIALLGHQP